MVASKTTTITSSTRLFPANRSTSSPHVVPLSIIDNKVLRFSPTGGYWFYDLATSFDRAALLRSLEEALNHYPQWAGQLRRRVYKPDSLSHTDRYGRLEVAWGSSDDPGVQVCLAGSSHSIADILPATQDGISTISWNGDHIPALELFPSDPLALHDTKASAGLPSAIIQLTSFACGGLCIAIKIAHPLADAQTLLSFMHDWSRIHRALSFGEPLSSPHPSFNPSQLDEAAAGNVDALDADPELMAQAQQLPLDRFDYWASSEGVPSFFAEAAKVPPEILARPTPSAPLGTAIPWSEWDVLVPVSHRLFYFSPEELARLKSLGTSPTDSSSSSLPSPPLNISHLDTLLSHIWSLITRARKLPPNTLTTLNLTLGLRPRLSPPLPSTSLGSPILLVPVRADAQTTSSDLATTASSIRSTVNLFDSSALGAVLHEAAFEDSPSRYWGGFLGERHTIVTSWTRLGVWEIDFGFGASGELKPEERKGRGKPRWVLPLMPHCDGLVQVMEGSGRGCSSADGGEEGPGRRRGWQEDGALVGLYLKSDVMERVLADPLLHR
ncbi:transferase family-domain-containing protein [Leucosporidium creatinivorum]|uniref:Transferase family-domain-containing protein n=1 Tax=Leucosporidium creatinivorum TaxID=106004 RepID=A0A1Y2FG63_9BASI|nr:transferase family-domain-containing protein [Leucosporidium creatinivorum]